MWTESDVMNRSVSSNRNVSKVDDPDLTWLRLNPVPLRNAGSTAGSIAAHNTITEDSVSGSSGIVPAIVAAALFITFLLTLYAVLWKCMVSPPQRKKSKLRVRVQQKNTV